MAEQNGTTHSSQPNITAVSDLPTEKNLVIIIVVLAVVVAFVFAVFVAFVFAVAVGCTRVAVGSCTQLPAVEHIAVAARIAVAAQIVVVVYTQPLAVVSP